MKTFAESALIGVCAGVMAAAAGIDSFSAQWWAWMLAAAIAFTVRRT